MFVRLRSNWNQADTNTRAKKEKRKIGVRSETRTYLMEVSSPFNRTVGILVIPDYRVVSI